jgi:hypothetical protein
MVEVSPGRYRHFKGADYIVLGVARESESKDRFVIYHPLRDAGELWIRPLAMWNETVTRGGVSQPRFRRVEASEA